MITELTQEQIDQIPHFAEKWFKIITSTNRPDKPKAKEAVREIYKILKLNTPEIFWYGSPMGMHAHIVSLYPDDPEYFYRELFYAIFRDGPHKKSRHSVHMQLYRCIHMQLYRFILESSEKLSSVLSELNSLFKDLRNFEHPTNGLFPMPEVFYYDYYVNCLGLENTPGLLKPLKQISESCFCVSLLEDVCILCERPTIFSINDKGQLHSENGPALAFKDGFEAYAINGEIQPKGKAMEPVNLERIHKLTEELANRSTRQNLAAQILGFCRRVKAEMQNPDNHTKDMNLEKAIKQYDEAVDKLLATFNVRD